MRTRSPGNSPSSTSTRSGGVWRTKKSSAAGECLERDRDVLVAAAAEHPAVAALHAHGQLLGEPGLADARLTRQQHHLESAGHATLPRVDELLEHLVAAGERQAGRMGEHRWQAELDRGRVRLGERRPQDLAGRKGFGQPFQLEVAQ